MKKIIKATLGFVCVASLFLASGQRADGSACIAWSLGCIAVAVLCGYGYARLTTKESAK